MYTAVDSRDDDCCRRRSIGVRRPAYVGPIRFCTSVGCGARVASGVGSVHDRRSPSTVRVAVSSAVPVDRRDRRAAVLMDAVAVGGCVLRCCRRVGTRLGVDAWQRVLANALGVRVVIVSLCDSDVTVVDVDHRIGATAGPGATLDMQTDNRCGAAGRLSAAVDVDRGSGMSARQRRALSVVDTRVDGGTVERAARRAAGPGNLCGPAGVALIGPLAST